VNTDLWSDVGKQFHFRVNLILSELASKWLFAT
jgi:hypothetical protein